VSHAGTIAWFARHESRLAWRDGLSMMTAGGRWRKRTVLIALVVFLAAMHLLALSMVGRFADISPDAGKATLLMITGCALLSWSLMVSQAMESVTRAFYARADLDLILSSPAAARKVFAVRIATMALSIVVMALLLAAPFINVLAAGGGVRWLGAYGVVVAMGALAAALALALTVALFRTIGPRRTRLVAQVVAAVIGAAFIISLQVAAILSSDTLSRFSVLESDTAVALAPDADSIVWWPARAILGDLGALAAVLGTSLVLLAAAILLFSKRFGEHTIAAIGVANVERQRAAPPYVFRLSSPTRMLRRKEWTLLLRDPWLVSQSLMQVLYLLPPALLLWRSFGEGDSALVLMVPVLVMAAGQLAGGLAWLAISGEDAPDLGATAPVPARQIIRAKIEAVMGAIALVFAPMVVWLAVVAPLHAVVATAGILIAAGTATAIQLWFRAQAKRSHFRRRQTSSRVATFAEAFSSITWAATAGLAAAGSWWFALVTAVIAILILAGTRFLSPRES
jgi:ABC-2 type transport system permease protein